MPYDIESIRKKMKSKMSGRQRDENEFIPPKAGADETLEYRFFILPPLEKGQPCVGGKASQTMENFFLRHATHWIDNKPFGCPRETNDEECEVCAMGFELMKDEEDKNSKAKIRSKFMPRTSFAVNIYFPNIKTNPEAFRGKVMFYNAPLTVARLWQEAINRDDAGDEENPQAFGVFYDEFNSFLFNLVVTKFGDYNDYKKSAFLAVNGSRPIAIGSDKKADADAINEILSKRHDLSTKIQPIDLAGMHRAYEKMIGEEDSGFDEDETEARPPKESKKPSSKAVEEEEEFEDSKASKPSSGAQGGKSAKRQTIAEDEDEQPPKDAKKTSKKESKEPAKAEIDEDDDMDDILNGLDDE